MMAKVPGDCLLGLETINKVLKLSSILQTICFMLLVFYTIYTFYIVFSSLNQGLKIVVYSAGKQPMFTFSSVVFPAIYLICIQQWKTANIPSTR